MYYYFSIDAALLQNVINVSVDNTSFAIKYTTVNCLQNSKDYYVQMIYNSITSTMSYVPSTTASFILSSLQPSTTVYYTLQVFNTANVPVSSSIVSSVVLSSILLTTCTVTSTFSTSKAILYNNNFNLGTATTIYSTITVSNNTTCTNGKLMNNYLQQ